MQMERAIAEKLVDFFHDNYKQHSYDVNAKSLEDHLKYQFREGFKKEWTLGGTSGGWSGDQTIISHESEPGMTELQDFLIKNYLQASYVQYLVIERKIDKDTRPSNDYYGGSQTYAYKKLSLKDLHDALLDAKLEPVKDDMVNVDDFISSYAQSLYPLAVKKKKKIK